jgi:hypothetical protein
MPKIEECLKKRKDRIAPNKKKMRCGTALARVKEKPRCTR